MEDSLQVINFDIGGLISQFLDSLDLADSSRNTLRRSLRQFLLWLSDEGITNPKREDVLRYKRSLEKKVLSQNTITSYIVSVRKFFQWLESENRYPNITNQIKGGGRVRGFRKDTLTPEQFQQLLSSIDLESPTGLRDYALVNLMGRSGIRCVEASRANCGDIRQENSQHVLYVQGKGRKMSDDFVCLTDKAYLPLMNYLAQRKATDSGPLFVSTSNRNQYERLTTRTISGIVKTLLRKNNLNSLRLSAHSLRHSAATWSLAGGADLCNVRLMMRHESISTTLEGLTRRGVSVKAYIRESKKEIELKAIEKLKSAGVEVVFKKGIHQKIAIIDNAIAWSGSLNILQHINSHDQMTRHNDSEHVKKLLRIL